MKQTLIDIASQVTPFTTPLAYAGAILIFVGCLALLGWVVSHSGSGLLRLSGRLLIMLGVLFLVLQLAGMALGLDASANFEHAWVNLDKKPFWLVGLVLFIPGFFMRLVGAIRPIRPSR